jgi:hypothetical protein
MCRFILRVSGVIDRTRKTGPLAEDGLRKRRSLCRRKALLIDWQAFLKPFYQLSKF